jgi:hypothetical protein
LTGRIRRAIFVRVSQGTPRLHPRRENGGKWGENGVYCHGGSWFFCDSGNYLLAGVHGLPAAEVDARLIERIKVELKVSPVFNEDIDTVSGKPHGNVPYADYSGYLWLRSEIRRRLGQKDPDPVGSAIDAFLKVVRDERVLRLELQM